MRHDGGEGRIAGMAFYAIEATSSTRTFPRLYREEVGFALSAIDCVLNGERAVYASSELTSGRRLNRLLRDVGANRASELRARQGEDWYRTQLWTPNVAAATAFARRLHQTLGNHVLVVTPAPLSAPGWSQREYLGFWEVLIRTRIKAVYFNEGWEYSHGCTFEFAVALDAGLPTYDCVGNPLAANEALERMEAAIRSLAGAVDAQPLADNLARARQLGHA